MGNIVIEPFLRANFDLNGDVDFVAIVGNLSNLSICVEFNPLIVFSFITNNLSIGVFFNTNNLSLLSLISSVSLGFV